MKKSIKASLAVLAFSGSTASALRLSDISENQKKLFAANNKEYGGEIHIVDMNHADDPEWEDNRLDLRLLKVNEDLRLHNELQKSSLDDPVSDRTVSTVKPSSEKENRNREWLTQKPKSNSNIQLSDEPDETDTILLNDIHDYENAQIYPFEQAYVQEKIRQQQHLSIEHSKATTQEIDQIVSMAQNPEILEKQEAEDERKKELRLEEQKKAREITASQMDNNDPDHIKDLQIDDLMKM